MEVQTNPLALEQLVALTSNCLLNEMRYYDSDEQRRDAIFKLLADVEKTDPEFILQLAVYLRRELGIRATTNFIFAYCACSSILGKIMDPYFQKAVLLPSDTIEVAQYTQIIHLIQSGKTMAQIKELNSGSGFDIRKKIFMPNQLKKSLTKKILTFSEYQLGKYCSEGYRKAVINSYLCAKKGQISFKNKQKKAREQKEKEKNKDAAEIKKVVTQLKARRHKLIHKKKPHQFNAELSKKNAIEKTFLTMKDLVGLLHMKPTLLTSAIIGVKYPATLELFEKRFQTQEKFDETLVGQKMKIKTPITWETQLSSKGNTKQNWQSLLANNKVPYLALLRNLRNIVKTNVSEELIQKAASSIENKENVHKNKSTPLQYLSAYETLKSIKPKPQEMVVEGDQSQSVQKAQILSKAILAAMEHSMSNCEKLKGTTMIFTDVSGSMQCAISGGKNYGSIRTCADLSILLGLMVNENCQNSKYYIFSSVGSHPKCYLPVSEFIKEGSIMNKMEQIKIEAQRLGGGTDFPAEVIAEAIQKKEKVDNIIIFSDMMISNGKDAGQATDYIQTIEQYQEHVNSNVRIFSCDLRGYSQSKTIMEHLAERNFIRIYGGSPSILKFISETEGDQIEYIRGYASSLET